MNSTARHVSRSPTFRALAWFAWLILAVSPAYGMPMAMGMLGGSPPAVPGMPVVQTMQHDQALTSASLGHCCDDGLMQAGHAACHCVSVCSSALPAVAMAPLAPVALSQPMVPWRDAVAPVGVRALLLRPPLF